MLIWDSGVKLTSLVNYIHLQITPRFDEKISKISTISKVERTKCNK